MERAYTISLEILNQRKYIVLDKDDERILAKKPDDELMCVFLTNSMKFNVESILEYILMMKN